MPLTKHSGKYGVPDKFCGEAEEHTSGRIWTISARLKWRYRSLLFFRLSQMANDGTASAQTTI